MPNPTGNTESLTAPRFVKGQSGNPGGVPGSRKRLTTRFLNALADDFDAHGKQAIEDCRLNKPEAYIKAIAALCPKEIELSHPLEDMASEDLLVAITALTSFLAAQGNDQGAEPPKVREPAH